MDSNAKSAGAPASVDYDLKQALRANRLSGLWRLMSGFHWTYFGATMSQGIAALSKTATYLLLLYLVDTLLETGAPARTLLLVAAGFVSLAAFEGIFTFLSGRLAAQTAEGIARRLRNYMFDHIQRLSFSYHAETSTGELISRSTSDVDALRRFFADQAIGVGRVLLLFIVNFCAILYLNWQLGLFSIIVVPFLIAVSFFFFKRVTKVYEAYQEQEATLSTTLQENLSGVRVVKAFARQDYERDKFEKDNREKYRRGRSLMLMHSLFWPVTDILVSIQLLGGYLMGALFAINGIITVGTYMAYAGMVIWLIWPMRNLGRLIVQMSTGMVSYGRVMDVIRQEREPLGEGVDPPDGKLRGDIVFDQVCFEYEADSPVLKDISFHVRPGQAVALLGSTGSGKTTLVNLLPRFYEYSSGKLTLDGIDLNRYSRRFLRRQIGIVEQEPFLFSRTIQENISYSVDREVTLQEVEAAARAAAIHDVIASFPDGYNTLVGEKGVTLSGGQKQRVAIARTLLKNPRILILDDSTSSVDLGTESEIRQALEGLMQGRTTFIIAHRIQSVMNADLILVMENGRIVQSGIHEDLMKESGMYRRIFDIQTRIEDELEREVSGATLASQKIWAGKSSGLI
ncbi:MAG: ABC transporter ATP-binding protein [Anaerolineales bacterium]|jgi:ATP-binding cassette, subfamily B, bacterial